MLLLAVIIIYVYIVAMGSFSSHFQSQNYNEFACGYMRENQEAMSIDTNPLLLKSVKASPFETAVGVASCGLVLPLYTNNTGNVTALITNYSRAACEYGNNNSFKQATWVRSLPVNITDGDIDYATIAPLGPPGMDPCYLIWRINTSYVERNALPYATPCATEEEVFCTTTSSAESTLKNGTIKRNVVTSLRIDYFKMAANGDLIVLCAGTGCDTVGFIEIWGIPNG